jgi:hypothetical protein
MMPRLLRSSETWGCGATIELDTGEVISVSLARSVMVTLAWRKGDGFLKTLFSGYGQKLYFEADPYKNAKTTGELLERFPDQAPELRIKNFKNPVLDVFANAVWHCSSAANVCMVLNGAAEYANRGT